MSIARPDAPYEVEICTLDPGDWFVTERYFGFVVDAVLTSDESFLVPIALLDGPNGPEARKVAKGCMVRPVVVTGTSEYLSDVCPEDAVPVGF